MKRRALLSEMGIEPGNLMHAHGHIRSRSDKHVGVGDLLASIAIGGNGKCVKLLVLLVRGGQTTITFDADSYRALAFTRIA